MRVDVSEIEPHIHLRPMTVDDYEAITALQLRCFPGMKTWRRDHFESQVRTFPEGQMGIWIDDVLAASSASLIVDYADYSDWHDWSSVSAGGSIRNHDPEGDTLYGIEIQVDPAFRGQKLARRLYDARKDLCREHNLARIVIGGRIPGFGRHQEAMTAREYVDAVLARRLHDPVLTAQLANDFVLRQLVPDYLPSDEDSAGWATILEWSNLDYVPKSQRRRRATQPVRVASVQMQMARAETFEQFVDRIEFFVDTASDYRADFLLFPELFVLQLLPVVTPDGGRPGEAARALATLTPRLIEVFRRLATSYNINIIAGSWFAVDEDERLLNVSCLFRRDGTVSEQAKLHITPAEAWWWGVQGGDDFVVHESDRGPVAIAICYDSEFPELGRLAAAKGARILFVPYNTSDRPGHLRVRYCVQARCIENHLYAVTAGCVGHLPRVENADLHYAVSGVYTPSDVGFARDGVAAEASPEIEALLVQDLDLQALRRHRQEGTVQNWNDRRTDMYRVTFGDEKI